MNMFKAPERKWLWRPFVNSEISLHFEKAPNRFHRFMQRLVLGFVWTKEP